MSQIETMMDTQTHGDVEKMLPSCVPGLSLRCCEELQTTTTATTFSSSAVRWDGCDILYRQEDISCP